MKHRVVAGLVMGGLGAVLGGAAGRARRPQTDVAEPNPSTRLRMYEHPPGRPIDALTGLPDASYFEIAAAGRVTAARRHLWPVTVVIVELGFGPAASTPVTQAATVAAFASLLRQTLRDADIACRLGRNTFGLVLEDTSEDGGVWTVERLQMAAAKDATAIGRLTAGLASYPTHGLEPADVVERARLALSRAVTAADGIGLGRVEVATAEP